MHKTFKIRDGDWTCAKCRMVIFGSKPFCFKCRLDRDGRAVDAATGGKVRRKEWNCEHCHHLNFARRDFCEKCTAARPSTAAVGQTSGAPGVYELGDWRCARCGEHNFKKRDKCRKDGCSGEKPMPKSDDSCVICFENPKDHVLVKCGHICMCGQCSRTVNSCPICRAQYDPDSEFDVRKVYVV